MSDTPLPLDPLRYQDGKLLATGGAAAIHVVRDQVLERPVAVKIPIPAAPADLARMRREAQVTAQLDHPVVVPIYDLGPDWFTMKRVQGATFGDMLRAEKDPVAALTRVIDTLVRVCEGLAFAHHRGVVHRDLKPENVMIGSFGQVYLMDWGIAQVKGETDVPFAGTAGWTPPEQARGELCDARSDVWGIGGLLYYALSGRKPNGSLTLDERGATGTEAQPVPPPNAIPGRPLPPELVRIAMKALALQPGDRYPDTVALAADLHGARADGWWFERRSFAEGAEILRQGQDADDTYFIVEGRCEVCQNGGPIAELGAGDTFGEAALVSGGARTATVTATTAVVVRVITRAALDEECRRGGWLGVLVKQLASRCMELQLDLAKRKG